MAISWQIGHQPTVAYDGSLLFFAACQPAWDGGQYVYILGGDQDTFAAAFLRYDISADSWTALTPPTYERDYGSSAVFDGKVYVFAGEGQDPPGGTPPDWVSVGGRTMKTLVYDIATDAWSTAASMPQFPIGTVTNNITGVAGTVRVTESVTPDFEFPFGVNNILIGTEVLRVDSRTLVSGSTYDYNITRNLFGSTGGAAAHTAGDSVYFGYERLAAGAFASDTYIYVIGGFGSGSNQDADDRVSRYNPGTDSWTELAAMPHGVFQISGVQDSQGRIYQFGDNSDNLDAILGHEGFAVQRFDPATETWDLEYDLFTKLVELDPDTDNMYTLQGVYLAESDTIAATVIVTNGLRTGETYIYDVATDTWSHDPDDDIGGQIANWASITFRGGLWASASSGFRHVILTGPEGQEDIPEYEVYYFEPLPPVELLSSFATLDHDLTFGVETGQHTHHDEEHALSDETQHTGGYLYKTGASVVVTDADFAAYDVTPTDGMVAVTHDTSSGIDLLWSRLDDVWTAVEVSD